MDTIIARVQKVLQKEFSPREIRLEPAGRGKIRGWIISRSFDELTDEERYQKVWRLCDAYLDKKDRDRILGFFAFTPMDEKFIFDGSFDRFQRELKRKSAALKRKKTIARNKSLAGKRAAHKSRV